MWNGWLTLILITPFLFISINLAKKNFCETYSDFYVYPFAFQQLPMNITSLKKLFEQFFLLIVATNIHHGTIAFDLPSPSVQGEEVFCGPSVDQGMLAGRIQEKGLLCRGSCPLGDLVLWGEIGPHHSELSEEPEDLPDVLRLQWGTPSPTTGGGGWIKRQSHILFPSFSSFNYNAIPIRTSLFVVLEIFIC